MRHIQFVIALSSMAIVAAFTTYSALTQTFMTDEELRIKVDRACEEALRNWDVPALEDIRRNYWRFRNRCSELYMNTGDGGDSSVGIGSGNGGGNPGNHGNMGNRGNKGNHGNHGNKGNFGNYGNQGNEGNRGGNQGGNTGSASTG